LSQVVYSYLILNNTIMYRVIYEKNEETPLMVHEIYENYSDAFEAIRFLIKVLEFEWKFSEEECEDGVAYYCYFDQGTVSLVKL